MLLAVITGYGAIEGFVFLVPLAVNGFLAGLAVGAGDVAFAVITLALFAFNLVVGFGGFALEALGAGRAVEALRRCSWARSSTCSSPRAATCTGFSVVG